MVITIELTIVSFTLGVLSGVVVAFARDHRFRVVRDAALVYVWVFRAIPTLVQLLFVWDALPQIFPVLAGTGLHAVHRGDPGADPQRRCLCGRDRARRHAGHR